MTFKPLTPTEERMIKIEIAQDTLESIKIATRVYLRTKSPVIKQKLFELKKDYDDFKKTHGL